MSDIKNILLVGVGGQGTILVSKILTAGLIKAGYDVKMSEIHGMAQRGGSVSTQVRYGKEVFSPIIGKGQADILVSFEVMEAVRWLEYLQLNGKVIVNDYQIPSAPILMGKYDYPEGLVPYIQGKAVTTVLNAATLATELGNPKVMNVILFGALVKAMGLGDIDWETAIKENVKPKTIDVNIRAFKAGFNN